MPLETRLCQVPGTGDPSAPRYLPHGTPTALSPWSVQDRGGRSWPGTAGGWVGGDDYEPVSSEVVKR